MAPANGVRVQPFDSGSVPVCGSEPRDSGGDVTPGKRRLRRCPTRTPVAVHPSKSCARAGGCGVRDPESDGQTFNPCSPGSRVPTKLRPYSTFLRVRDLLTYSFHGRVGDGGPWNNRCRGFHSNHSQYGRIAASRSKSPRAQ